MNTPPIIDQGILKAETGLQFRYRCFLNMPLGMGILYAVDKTPERVLQEIQLEQGGHDTVFWQNTGQVLAVFKHEDGSVEVPCVMLNVYAAVLNKRFDLLFIEDGYEENHEKLFGVFSKYYEPLIKQPNAGDN